jgi:hypothetical protein
MFPEFTREELAAGLDRVAGEILQEAGVERPPVDAAKVAGALRIAIAVDDRQDGRARYVRLNSRRADRSQAAILLKPEPRAERRQWAIAHEIGEHAAYRVFAAWGADPRAAEPGAREVVANHLAGRLLLPTKWFAAEAAECGWDLLALKRRFSTASHELIARRMLECRPPVVISIFDQRQLSFRRGNLPGLMPAPLPAELDCWRRAHEGRVALACDPRGFRVQAWPIHEDGWKREILRTEIEECD